MLRFLFTSDALPAYELETDPIGWPGLRYVFVRDQKYHGVSLEMTTDLTFIKRAGEYLRTLYEAFGIQALCYLSIFQYNPNEFRSELASRMRVDFTKYSVTEGGVSVPLKEQGFTTKLLNRDTTEVDLFRTQSIDGVALPPLSSVELPMHSQVIRKEYRAGIDGDVELRSPINYVTDGESRYQTLYIGFGQPTTDEFGIGTMANGPITLRTDSGTVRAPFYVAQENGDFELSLAVYSALWAKRVVGKFHTLEAKYYWRLNDETPVLLKEFRTTGITSDSYYKQVDFIFARTVPVKTGDKLYLYADVHMEDIEGNALSQYQHEIYNQVNPGSFISMRALTSTPETTAVGVLTHEALERLAQALTGRSGGALYSEYYGRTDLGYAQDGEGALRLLTSGFQLRGFPLSEQSLFASFRDLYDSLDAIDCLGMGLERRDGREVVRIEPRRYFYQDVEVLRLGAVSDLRKSPQASLLYSSAQFGYSRWESGAPNGLDEFNGTRTYTLPLSEVSNDYSMLSKYSAAGCLIEEVRRQPYQLGTKAEGKADKNNFLISLRRTMQGGLATEQGEAFATVTGIQALNTAYNLRLSPGRNLRRHGAWLRAGLTHETDRRLIRGEVEGNDRLVSQRVGEAQAIDEHADVDVLDLPAPYAEADAYEFTWELSLAQLHQLRKNPYGRISFLDRQGRRKSGFLLKAERETTSGKTAFTLLKALPA